MIAFLSIFLAEKEEEILFLQSVVITAAVTINIVDCIILLQMWAAVQTPQTISFWPQEWMQRNILWLVQVSIILYLQMLQLCQTIQRGKMSVVIGTVELWWISLLFSSPGTPSLQEWVQWSRAERSWQSLDWTTTDWCQCLAWMTCLLCSHMKARIIHRINAF